MMEIKIRNILGAGLIACCTNSNAALINYDNGLIYDDILDISWLADANLAASNTFGTAGVQLDGAMSWYTALDWVDGLNTSNYLGYSNWRLPTVAPVDGFALDYDVSYDGSTDRGFNNTSTSNELSHLYYTGLGNLGLCTTNNATGSSSDTCEITPDGGWGLKNTDPFTNLMSYRYWTGVENELNTERAFDMDFTFGQIGTGAKGGGKFVIAVLDGNVSAVPIPAAIWLFSAGLVGLTAVARRRKI